MTGRRDIGSRPLRVCMVVTYDLVSPGGGVKQHAMHLADALRRMGDEVAIIGPASGPLREGGLTGFGGVVNIPGNGSDNYLGLFVSPWKVRRFFSARRFDVVHVHEPLLPALSHWAVWQTPGAAHVCTFHAYAEEEPRLVTTLRAAGAGFLSRNFQRGIAVSPLAASYAAAAWREPLSIIPNGVPTRIFHPPDGASAPADGPLRLLFVGRLGDRRKGIRFLLDAYARLVARGAPVTLDVVGELGGEEPPPAMPGLVYHGALPLPDLARCYRDCDLFVAPSTGQESFGIVLLEAMASGRPVLCSDIDGYRQVAPKEGARFVAPGDTAALERAIAELAADRSAIAAMGAANLRHALAFDWDQVARRVRAEYLSAAELACP